MSKIWAFFVNSAERGFQPILRADVEWIVNTEHVRPGRSYPTLPRDVHIWRATPEVTDACEEWVVGDASESVRPIPPSRRARVRRALLYYYSVITKLYWGRLAGRYSLCRLHWEGGCYAHLSPAVNSLGGLKRRYGPCRLRGEVRGCAHQTSTAINGQMQRERERLAKLVFYFPKPLQAERRGWTRHHRAVSCFQSVRKPSDWGAFWLMLTLSVAPHSV